MDNFDEESGGGGGGGRGGEKEREGPSSSQNNNNNNATSFDALPIECIVRSLQYLEFEDLNSFAVVSKRFLKARNDESLDQTRSGTIRIISRKITVPELLEHVKKWKQSAFFRQRRDDPSPRRRLHLRIECSYPLYGYGYAGKIVAMDRDGLQFPGVRLLQFRSPTRNVKMHWYFNFFAELLPSLEVLDIGDVPVRGQDSFFAFSRLPKLHKIRWERSNHPESEFHTLMSGGPCYGLRQITDLFLDGATFSHCIRGPRDSLFEQCRSQLERVSVRNATSYESHHRTRSELSQDYLVEFVRNAPKLQWFRSDLTAENVAVLQLERPDVTFCS